MYSSQNNEILSIYKSPRTVFTLKSIQMLTGASDPIRLSARLNYYVRKGELLNPRRGIYCKPGYNSEELCGQLYRPSYLSLEYVLQKVGVIFQYDSAVTAVSYLSREIEVDGATLRYRGVKSPILLSPEGIEFRDTYSIATPERALLDVMYLNSNYFFDNLRPISQSRLRALLPLYGCKKLNERVEKLFKDS